MRPVSHLLGATAALALLGSSAALAAEPVTLDVFYAFPSFAKFYDQLAEEFTAANPDIRINFRAPASTYDEGHQTMLRQAVTNELPDVNFSGMHLLHELVHTLAQRDQIIDIEDFIAAEPEGWVEENYAESILDLGRVDGVQYGLTFNASMPIMYFNADLVREAGGDPDDMPTDWPGVIALAADINALEGDAVGISYSVNDWPDEWLWDGMILQDGGHLTRGDKVAFGDESGLRAVTYFRQFVTEGGMPVIDTDQARQSFVAGQIGMTFDTPARLRLITDMSGGRFDLRTALFPIDNKEEGGLPTGGNVAVITASTPEKQQAAWEFLKFMTSPEAQTVVVESTGYLPTNKRATGPEYLADHYAADANNRTILEQVDRAMPWPSYSKGNMVRIWRTQRDIIGTLMQGDLTPEEGLERLVNETQALMVE